MVDFATAVLADLKYSNLYLYESAEDIVSKELGGE